MSAREPIDPKATPEQRVRTLQAEIGAEAVARWCIGLLSGDVAYDDPAYPPLPALAGPGAASELQVGNLDARGAGYWPRVWAARGLLHGWQSAIADEAVPVLVAALGDEAWRVREMSAKVIRRWEIAEAADRLAELVDDETPRVRVAALRALAVIGEAEHLDAVRSALDDAELTVRNAAEETLARLDERLDRSPEERRTTVARARETRRQRPAPGPTRAATARPPTRRMHTRKPFTADDFDAVVAQAVDALRPAVDRDWGVEAGAVAWTCNKIAAHIADDLFAFAAQLAARVPSGYLPFVVSPRRKTAPDGMLNNILAGAALVSLAVRAAPADARGFHPWGMGDAEGLAALAAAEVIVHSYDIASTFGIDYQPEGTHCTSVVDRLGQDIDLPADERTAIDPLDLLLWATGRRDLPSRPRRTRWRWWPEPTADRPG